MGRRSISARLGRLVVIAGSALVVGFALGPSDGFDASRPGLCRFPTSAHVVASGPDIRDPLDPGTPVLPGEAAVRLFAGAPVQGLLLPGPTRSLGSSVRGPEDPPPRSRA